MLDLERRISEFKMKYGDALPDAMARNENALDRIQRESDAIDAQIRLVEQQESLLKLQLGQISPTLVADKGGDIYTQLGMLRAQLAEAQQKYTPDHPDVKSLTRAMQALAEQAKLGNPENVRPDNPEYMRVDSELRAVRTNLAALRSNAARARTQMADYERRLAQTPGVEREYVQLMRQREIAQVQYGEIEAKLRSAGISQTFESESKGERYSLIRKPFLPSKPDSPNRLGIILLGLVLGGGLAVGLAAFRESADPTVRASHDVTEISDLPLLGAIPKLQNPVERRRNRLTLISVAGVYLVATLVVAIVTLNAG
jgi:polysaccharide biosynthesis transport protein